MMKRYKPTYAWILAGGAAICGFLQALPYVGVEAQAGELLAAARGEAARQGLAGFEQAGWRDQLAGWLWSQGGEGWLMTALVAERFVFWTVVALVVLAGAWWLSNRLTRRRSKIAVVGAAVLFLAGSCLFTLWRGFAKRETLSQPTVLTTPTELAEVVHGRAAGSVFASPTALPFLVLLEPGVTGKLDLRTATALTANPPKWRESLRREGWTAVCLSGPASEYRPLLAHLLVSPDWRLSRVSNQGYVFTREEGPAAAKFDPESFHLANNRATAIYLAQVAERYDGVRRSGEARAAIDQALKYAPRDPEVLVHAASLEANRKQWQNAISLCDKALDADRNSSYAKLLKTLSLLELGQPAKAEQLGREVLQAAPRDPYTLFLYARVCRTLNDYETEAETLERLIKVSRETSGEVPGGYYVYLGQAYAKMGRPDEALKNYREALKSPDLGPDFSSEVREAIQTIESRKQP